MNALKALLFHADLEKEDFDALLPDAAKENRKNLEAFSLIMAIFFFSLVALNALTRGFAATNMPVYAGMAVVNFTFYWIAKKTLSGHPECTVPAIQLYTAVLYVFSLVLTALHPDQPAVTVIAVLLIVPFLFTDQPFRVAAGTFCAVALLCTLSWLFKPRQLAKIDTWNGISFGTVAVIADLFQIKRKFRMLYQARKIKYMSETDVLTGAKNRNRYENRLTRYPQPCVQSLGCMYADVNGLHELNNQSGHQAGDKMLQAAAAEIMRYFGPEHTYRVGGDEFIAFRLDTSPEAMNRDAETIAAALLEQGYNISIGVAVQEKAALDMEALTLEAEKGMFESKQAYYEQTGKDRRRR